MKRLLALCAFQCLPHYINKPGNRGEGIGFMVKPHRDDIQGHTSDTGMTYKYIRVTYGWDTSTHDWHTNGIRVHIDKIWAHTNDMQMTCEWNIKQYKGFGAFKS